MGGRRDIDQRIRVSERDKGNARYRSESLVSQVGEAKGMVGEARDREIKAKVKYIRGNNDDINDMGKERDRDIERGVRDRGMGI